MSSQQESYKLRWGEFQGNLVESLQDLRESEEFLDVTLCSDEDHQLRAHKVILSASSSYFRGVLKRNSAKHPVLLMPPNVRFRDLAALIEFMYNGEVSVNNEELESFMALAELLKVKGLTQDKPHKVKPPPPKMPKFPSGIQINRQRSAVSSQPSKRPRIMTQQPPPPPPPPPSSSSVASSAASMEEFPPEDEDEDGSNDIQEVPGDDSNEFFEEFDSSPGEYYQGDSSHNQPQTTSTSTGTQLMGLICPDCRMMCHGVQALKDHMAHSCRARSRSNSGTYNRPNPSGSVAVTSEPVICNICDKSFKNQKSMLAHQKRLHKVGCADETGNGGSIGSGPGILNHAMVKKRGRPCKKPQPVLETVGDETVEDESDYFETLPPQASVSQQPKGHEPSSARPVGQVPPAPRPSGSVTPQPSQSHQDPTKLVDDGSQSRPPSQGNDIQQQQQQSHQIQPNRPPNSGTIARGPQRMGGMSTSAAFRKSQPQQQPRIRHPQLGAHGRNMDLQKLGMKFGGQISITSSDNQPGGVVPSQLMPGSVAPIKRVGGANNSGGGQAGVEGVSITKLKGDLPVGSPLSIKDATGRRSQPIPQDQQSPVEVKEEPTEQYEEVGDEHAEGAEDYDESRYPEEEFDPSQGNFAEIGGGAVDGMYEGYENNMDEDMEDESNYVQTTHGNRRFNAAQQPNTFNEEDYQTDEGHKM